MQAGFSEDFFEVKAKTLKKGQQLHSGQKCLDKKWEKSRLMRIVCLFLKLFLGEGEGA